MLAVSWCEQLAHPYSLPTVLQDICAIRQRRNLAPVRCLSMLLLYSNEQPSAKLPFIHPGSFTPLTCHVILLRFTNFTQIVLVNYSFCLEVRSSETVYPIETELVGAHKVPGMVAVCWWGQ